MVVNRTFEKLKTMESFPITSWQIDGGKIESDMLYVWEHKSMGKVTQHGIKWFLFFGRKAMTDLDSLLKSRGIALSTKVCIGKAMATYMRVGP